jgi:hypothetical protein
MHKTWSTRTTAALGIAMMALAGVARAQNEPKRDTQGNPINTAAQAAQRPIGGGNYHFVVEELRGTVKIGSPTADPKNESEWTAVKVGDQIPPGKQIKTGIRSSVKLAMSPAEPPTVVMFESLALAIVDELFKGQDGEGNAAVVSRIGLAQGAVRAGVVEGGEVRSDMEIRSPSATLAKRGTWDFRFFVERGTGNFQISLASRGLVQAIQNQSGRSVMIRPGQRVTQAMMRWIESVKFDRVIQVQDWYGLRGAELIFNLNNQSGLGVLSPSGDAVSILNLTGRLQQQAFIESLDRTILDLLNQPTGNELPIGLLDFRFGPRRRPEGDFGIGTGIIPVFLNANSKAVQKRIAQPGRMDFWRQDLRKLVSNKSQIRPK